MEQSEVNSRELFREDPANRDYQEMPLGRLQAHNPLLDAEGSLIDNHAYGRHAMHLHSSEDNLLYWEIRESKRIGHLQTVLERNPTYSETNVGKTKGRVCIDRSQTVLERNPAYGKTSAATENSMAKTMATDKHSTNTFKEHSPKTLKMASKKNLFCSVAITAFVTSGTALAISLALLVVFLAQGLSGEKSDKLGSMREELQRLMEQLNQTKQLLGVGEFEGILSTNITDGLKIGEDLKEALDKILSLVVLLVRAQTSTAAQVNDQQLSITALDDAQANTTTLFRNLTDNVSALDRQIGNLRDWTTSTSQPGAGHMFQGCYEETFTCQLPPINTTIYTTGCKTSKLPIEVQVHAVR